MKNFIKGILLMLFTGLFMFLALSGHSQDTATVATSIDLGNFSAYFVNIQALAGLVVIITAIVNKLIILNKKGKQILSWFIAIGLAYLGWFLKLGMLLDMSWWMVIVYGFMTGLIANGIFDFDKVKWLLSIFNLAKTRKKIV